MFGNISRAVLFACFSLAFARMTLPVPPSDEVASLYPLWAKPISFGNVLIHELLFVFWIIFLSKKILLKRFLYRGPARLALTSLAALAVWTGLVSLLGPQPFLDIARSGRLILNILMFLVTVSWVTHRPTDALISCVLGLWVGTIVNLLMTFAYPLIVLDSLRLAGQNTPGVAMGIGVHLTAWWFFRETAKFAKFSCLLITIFFLWGCSLSFSRIGWFAAGLGLASWFIVGIYPSKKAKGASLVKVFVRFAAFCLIVMFAVAGTSQGRKALGDFVTLFDQKMNTYVAAGEGDRTRLAYVVITTRIAMQNPLGVGYSGYLDAQRPISPSVEGSAVEEEGYFDANPHAALLWYLSAGGVVGLILASCSLLWFLRTFLVSFRSLYGARGSLFAVFLIAPYLVIACTVTYLFNAPIMLIPVAIVAGWSIGSARARHAAGNAGIFAVGFRRRGA